MGTPTSSPPQNPETRTALARIVMGNSGHIWHPGCFVTASVVTDRFEAPVRVPLSAVIPMGDEGTAVVFVEDDHGFRARPIRLGRRDSHHAEVVSGLEPGERYVATGGFSLKAELAKETFGDGHGH